MSAVTPRRGRGGRLALAALAFLLAGALVAALGARWIVSPADPAAPPAVFVVEPGATFSQVARALEAQGLVRSRLAVRALGRLREMDRRLRAGEYDLSASMSTEEIVTKLAEGRVRTIAVVVPEGWTAAEIAQRLGEAGLADPGEFLALVRDPALSDELGVEGPGLEGYLFPETYQFARGVSAREIARAFVAQFKAVWEPIAPLAAARGASQRTIVTLASIVEKETAAPQERPIVASVYWNRLARGMRLDSDPTVIYGIPGFDGNLRRSDLEDERNPYNTYRITGLPPGPIANPGAAALRATADPAETPYLFFVSRNDGTHVFSRTLDEQAREVNRYQRSRR